MTTQIDLFSWQPRPVVCVWCLPSKRPSRATVLNVPCCAACRYTAARAYAQQSWEVTTGRISLEEGIRWILEDVAEAEAQFRAEIKEASQ